MATQLVFPKPGPDPQFIQDFMGQHPMLKAVMDFMRPKDPVQAAMGLANPLGMPVFATGEPQVAQALAKGIGGRLAGPMAQNLEMGGSQMAAIKQAGGNIDDVIALIHNPLTRDYGMTLLHELTHAGQAVRGLPSNFASVGARIANELGAWLPAIRSMPGAAEKAIKPLTNYFSDEAGAKLGSQILESLGLKPGAAGRAMAQQFVQLLKSQPEKLMQKFSEVINPAYAEHLGIHLSPQQVTQMAQLGQRLAGKGGFKMGPEMLSTLKGKPLQEIMQAFMQMVR